MNILRIIASVDPAMGGPSEALRHSVSAMSELGHSTEVLTLDPPDRSWLSNYPVPIHALGPSTRPYAFNRQLVPWLRSRRDQYDIVVLHGIWNYSSFGAWRALAGHSTPYVLFIHGMLDPWFRKAYPRKHWAKQAYWWLAEGRVLRDASRVLFTTEEERRLARGAFNGYQYKEDVVAYGTADVPQDTLKHAEAWQERKPELLHERFLLFLSRIHPKKGCDLLIRAFANVAKNNPDLDLIMAGPDQIGWQAGLEDLARSLGVAERVHWVGMLSGDVKWGALRAAEAFVLPSHGENFGIAVAEAMGCGTPVLITDRVNIWREVKNSNGGIVASDDLEGVTSLFRDWLSLSDSQQATMRKMARIAFLRHFEVKNAALDLAALFETIIEGTGSIPQTDKAHTG